MTIQNISGSFTGAAKMDSQCRNKPAKYEKIPESRPKKPILHHLWLSACKVI
ncbi:hypothetical protein HYX07_04870 [Candidatus Woesearchaeota archaeon]|nr:hypothetical protein [Candidatus Woesearchaeota archaeon]